MIRLNRTTCFVLFLFSIIFFFFLFNNIHRQLTNFINISDCDLSLSESGDFFCESNDDWNRRKELFHLQHNRNRYHDSPYMFFQDNYEPTFSCRYEQRLGINGDGGKWICDPYRLKQSETCLIYSLGSNGEFSFENETNRYLPDCDIHTFDMKEFNCTDICTFHQVRIGDGVNGTKTLRMVMSDLNHTGRYLEILKIDVEGSEYEFFEDLFNKTDDLSGSIRQILVEIHLSKIIRKVGNNTVYDYFKVHRLFQLFHDKHFVIFHKEVNLYNPYNAFEFSWIKLDRRFFQINYNSTTKKAF